MAGYIGSKTSVTQVDGYNRTEADAEFVSKDGDTITAAGTALTLDRTGSDGTILDLKKDGSSVGSIGAIGGGMYIGDGDTGLEIDGANNAIYPFNTSTLAATDGHTDLGDSDKRFKDLYLSGGVYLGGTGSANLLDDYEEGTYIATITCSTSGSITINTGYDDLAYTRIGNTVHVHGRLRISSVSSPVGIPELSLPFTSANITGDGGRVSGVCYLQNATNNLNEYGLHPTLESLSYVQIGRINGTAFTNTIANEFSGNELIFVSLTYRAA